LYDQEANELQLHSLQMKGENRSADIPKRRPIACTPLEETILARRPVVIDNIDLAGFTPEVRDIMADHGIRTMCCVPLFTPNRTLGSLNLTRMQAEAFTAEDLKLLSQVAGQIAIALENSLNYQEITRLKENLATEKLYLKEEIRSDKNLAEILGEPKEDVVTAGTAADAAERDRIIFALREAGGIVGGRSGAAARLGLKRTTLQSRMKKLNISREYR